MGHFYDLKITFEYTGVIPKNIMSNIMSNIRPNKYDCSTASFKIRILKDLYLYNEKVLEAQILSDLYWDVLLVT